jgi:hypothetical protein
LEGSASWKQARIESRILSREVGDLWIQHRTKSNAIKFLPLERLGRGSEPRLPVLEVPSVIIPQESNYLVDPDSAEIQALVWGEPKPFRLDPRLLDLGLREK